MEQYAIYLRKSRNDDPNATIEETLFRHEKILLETAQKMKLNIIKIYREVVSGETISDRPEMQSLLDDIDKGLYRGVLVVEIERLARGSSIDQGIIAQSFQLSGTNIITPNKIIDPNNEFDSESFEFSLFMSRREYKTINRRLQQGRMQSVKEGKFVGNKTPYGYIRHKIENEKGFTLLPHPEQAPVVKMIFDLYTQGERLPDGSVKRLGVSLIVRKLNDLKIPSATGNNWVPSTIQSLIRNPVYIGKIRWNHRPNIKKIIDGTRTSERPRAKKENWTIANGLHEALVSEEVFTLANNLIESNPPRPNPSQSKTSSPLAGIVTCGVCGRKMVRRPYQKKGQLATLLCHATSCSNISSTVENVESAILGFLQEWVDKFKAEIKKGTLSPVIDISLVEKSKEKIETEIKTLEKQLENTYDLLEQNVYTTEVFLERSKLLGEKITLAKKDHLELLKEIEKLQVENETKNIMLPQVEHVLKTYFTEITAKEKNDLLHQVLKKVVYLKKKKRKRSMEPDKFEIKVQLKTANN